MKLEIANYRKKFPDAKLITDSHHNRQVQNQVNIKKDDADVIIEYDNSLSDIEKSPQPI